MGYFAEGRVLEVRFKPKVAGALDVYRYARVKPEEWAALEGASSKGMMLYSMRNNWPDYKLTDDDQKKLDEAPTEIARDPDLASEEDGELFAPLPDAAPPSEEQVADLLRAFDRMNHHRYKKKVAAELDAFFDTTYEGSNATKRARACVEAFAKREPERVAALIKRHD